MSAMTSIAKRGGVVAVLILFMAYCGGCSVLPWKWGNQAEKGKACWYGSEFQGKPTASGEAFDMNKMTAAHRKLPFNTIVLVKNLENGRTVKVRINDRGPWTRGRLIDLSKAAAAEIGMLSAGVVPVRIEVLKWGPR